MKDYIVSVCAIASITVIILFALSEGIDGVLLAGGIATVAGLAGYKVSSIIRTRRGK